MTAKSSRHDLAHDMAAALCDSIGRTEAAVEVLRLMDTRHLTTWSEAMDIVSHERLARAKLQAAARRDANASLQTATEQEREQ